MTKDSVPIPSELLFLREIIFSHGCHVFFDVDGTIKGTNTPEAPIGFNPKLPHILAQLNKIPGLSIGACTSQSPKELYSYLFKMYSGIDSQLMSGLSILEDGHILANGDQHMITSCTELISPVARNQIAALQAELKKLWTPTQDPDLTKDGWGLFPGVTTPVAIPEGKYQGVVTMSIWEKGPDMHDPDYHGEYEPVTSFVSQVAQGLGANLIECREVGNGTLRIVQKGVSKESALADLAAEGVINLKKTVYIGDGLNDVAPAQLVTQSGGGVIAVANAISELKQIAVYVCKKPESHGVVEALSLILDTK